MPKYTIDLLKIAPEDQEFYSKIAAKQSYLNQVPIGSNNGFAIGFAAFENVFQEILPKICELLSTKTDSENSLSFIREVKKTFSSVVSLPANIKSEFSFELKKLKPPYLIKAVTKDKNNIEQITFEDITNNISETENAIIHAWLSFIDSSLLNQKQQEIGKNSVSIIVTHKNQPDISGSAFILGGKDTLIEIQSQWGEFNPNQKTDILRLNPTDLSEQSYQISPQKNQLVYLDKKYKSIDVAEKFQNERKIDTDSAIQIARSLKKIHSEISNSIEVKFEITGKKIYFTEINTNIEKGNKVDGHHVAIDLPILENLKPVFPGLVSGFGKIIDKPRDLQKLKRGDIAVLNSFRKNYLPSLKKASGIILKNSKNLSTEVLPKIRNLGLTSAIGSIKKLPTSIITLNGKTGKVYQGAYSPRMSNNLVVNNVPETETKITKTATKIFLHLKNTSFPIFKAEEIDGIGPIHSELFFTNFGIHPNELTDKSKLKQITSEISHYLISLSKSLPEKPIVYQISDFKTSDLINLKGGEKHEIPETNPFLGKRGSLRHLEQNSILEAEINIVKNMRNKSKIKNIWISLPFIRTLEELKNMKKIFSRLGLYRSANFKILVTFASPSTIYLIDDFIKEGIDGYLVDYFDFANLLYGRDFSYQQLSLLEDEAQLRALETIFKPALKAKLFTGIFNMPTDNKLKLINKIVNLGVKSVSVPNQHIVQIRQELAIAEKQLVVKTNN